MITGGGSGRLSEGMAEAMGDSRTRARGAIWESSGETDEAAVSGGDKILMRLSGHMSAIWARSYSNLNTYIVGNSCL